MTTYKTVEEFLHDLDADKKAQVETLHKLIQSARTGLSEHIKWNAPSYVLDGEDRITFNLTNKEGTVKLILHMGATRKEDKKGEPILQDPSGLVAWSSDIRGILSFKDLDDVKASQDAVAKIVRDWLAIKP
jgi:hypothetical protein